MAVFGVAAATHPTRGRLVAKLAELVAAIELPQLLDEVALRLGHAGQNFRCEWEKVCV